MTMKRTTYIVLGYIAVCIIVGIVLEIVAYKVLITEPEEGVKIEQEAIGAFGEGFSDGMNSDEVVVIEDEDIVEPDTVAVSE